MDGKNFSVELSTENIFYSVASNLSMLKACFYFVSAETVLILQIFDDFLIRKGILNIHYTTFKTA